jgi:hypothetical protein
MNTKIYEKGFFLDRRKEIQKTRNKLIKHIKKMVFLIDLKSYSNFRGKIIDIMFALDSGKNNPHITTHTYLTT